MDAYSCAEFEKSFFAPHERSCVTGSFGHRSWEFAAVVTGMWLECAETSSACVVRNWVRDAAKMLLTSRIGQGVYGADLGPSDYCFSMHAFDVNLPRVRKIQQQLDPSGVFRFACPLPSLMLKPPMLPPEYPPFDAKGNMIIVVSGPRFSGKDFVAGIMAASLSSAGQGKVRVVSIRYAFIRLVTYFVPSHRPSNFCSTQ